MEYLDLTSKMLYERFDEYNKKYFGGILPFTSLVVEPRLNVYGVFSYNTLVPKEKRKYTIRVNGSLGWHEDTLQRLLVHEMVHLYIAHKGFFHLFSHGLHFNLIRLIIWVRWHFDISLSKKLITTRPDYAGRKIKKIWLR